MSAIKLTSKDYFENAYKELQKELGITNPFSLPKIEKVVINSGIGKFEKAEKEEVADYLEKLTGQVPKVVSSKVSIAGFKLRAGDINGVTVTLRGSKVKDFILNLVYLSLPRTKDFKGIKKEAFDKSNRCFSVGIPNASIFPQVGFASKVVFPLQVNIVFKDGNKDNVALLEKLNFPFKK